MSLVKVQTSVLNVSQVTNLSKIPNPTNENLKSRKLHLSYITDVFLVFSFTIPLVTKTGTILVCY